MQDPTKSRRTAGRLAILAATAIALPLTATVVPVFAEDTPKAEEGATGKKEIRTRKVIIIKDRDDKSETIDIKGDADTPFVKTIEKDGKTIVLRSNKELSEAEVENMVAEAEQSRAQVEVALGEAEAKRGEAEAAAGEAEAKRGEAEAARGDAEARKGEAEAAHTRHIAHISTWTSSNISDSSDAVPNIDISEMHSDCKDGEHVTANGYDGKDKAAIAISICGKGNAKLAWKEAISGLKEAQMQLKDDKDLPKSVRKSVMESLQQQIDRLEKQHSEDKDEG